MAKKYEGLFNCPASDGNFTSGILRLNNAELEEFHGKLLERELEDHCHKGRINAVAKEIRKRGTNSKEIIAVEKMQIDIETADRLYGDGMMYDRDRIENEIKFYLSQSAQSLFESGKRFNWLKAREGHGGFYAALDRIGVSPTTAQYAMAVVHKFGPNPPALGDLGAAKFKMLTVFDDEDVKKYAEGGPLGDIPHDDVAKMTTRELQEALRAEREKRKKEKKTQEDAISKKEEKLNELEQKLRYQEPPTREQLAAVQLEPLKKKLFEHLLQAQFHLDEAVNATAAAQKVDGATFPQLQEWAMAHYEQLAPIGDLFEELDQALNNCGPDKPELRSRG
jgi:hypothetical protein